MMCKLMDQHFSTPDADIVYDVIIDKSRHHPLNDTLDCYSSSQCLCGHLIRKYGEKMRWITFQPVDDVLVIVLCADMTKKDSKWKVERIQTCLDDWRYRHYNKNAFVILKDHLTRQGVFERRDYYAQVRSHDLLHPEYDFHIETLLNGDIRIE